MSVVLPTLGKCCREVLLWAATHTHTGPFSLHARGRTGLIRMLLAESVGDECNPCCACCPATPAQLANWAAFAPELNMSVPAAMHTNTMAGLALPYVRTTCDMAGADVLVVALWIRTWQLCAPGHVWLCCWLTVIFHIVLLQ